MFIIECSSKHSNKRWNKFYCQYSTILLPISMLKGRLTSKVASSYWVNCHYELLELVFLCSKIYLQNCTFWNRSVEENYSQYNSFKLHRWNLKITVTYNIHFHNIINLLLILSNYCFSICRLPDSSSLTTINLQTLLEKYFKVQSLSLMLIIFQPTLLYKHLQYSKFKTVFNPFAPKPPVTARADPCPF